MLKNFKIRIINMFFSEQMDNQIVVSDYVQMDRKVLREERAYILNLVKQIKKQDVMFFSYRSLF